MIDNSKKKGKKIQKTKKFLYGFIASQNRMEKAKKERKQKLSLRFVLARTVIENLKKNRKKIQKIKKHLCGLILSQNRLEKAEKGKN